MKRKIKDAVTLALIQNRATHQKINQLAGVAAAESEAKQRDGVAQFAVTDNSGNYESNYIIEITKTISK